ncbi:MAG: hypothetical protein ACQUHE_05310 [Bacteroidia bacterium]
MTPLKFSLPVFLCTLCISTIVSITVLAHNPPTCGQTDCGLIQGSTFYSAYYSPGNPNGTPVSAGGGIWTKTSNSSCGTYNYQGYNYTLYPYKFICALPLDTNNYLLVSGIGIFGFFKLRRRLEVVRKNG